MENADYLYLYCLALDGRIFPVRGLPGPESQPVPPGSPPWTRKIKPLVDGAMSALTKVRPIDDLDINYRVQVTYDALAQVASELERVPGRKSLVWLTDGVPIGIGPNRSDTGEPVDFTPLLRHMSQAFDRSGVAIYPVRRVMIGSPDSMGGAGTTGVGSLATLDLFAQLTGGRPDAGKDIAAAVRQAVSDMRTSYQIGYYPPAGNWDDKLHKLHVTCTRKGVRIQAKSSYYAWREPAGARSQQAINSTVRTMFDAAEIGMRGSVSRDPKGSGRVHIDAHIDARDLVLAQVEDAYRGELRVALVGYAAAGQAIPSRVVPMDLHLTQQEYEKTLREGVHVAQDVAVPEDVERMRLIVFDRGSTAIGSLTIPVPEGLGKSK